MVPGFEVRSFGWAMLGELLVGLVSMLIGNFGRKTDVKLKVLAPPRWR